MTFPTQPQLIETPGGEYSLPLVRCAQLLASCDEVAAMLGVDSPAEAFDLIDYPLRDVETYGPPLPGVIVQGLKQRASWSGDQQGEMLVSLWDVVNPSYAESQQRVTDWKNDELAWLNRCGAIRRQMKTISKTPMSAFGGVAFNALRWSDECYPCHDYQQLSEDAPALWHRFAAFKLEWTT